MKGKILICDDDQAIRNMVQAILESDGWQVIAAEDGMAGAEILDKKIHTFTCAVLDVRMPRLSGIDLLTRMKLHSHTNTIPVIMLTGEATNEDMMTGYSQGAEYYITKPFTRQQLLFGLQNVLG